MSPFAQELHDDDYPHLIIQFPAIVDFLAQNTPHPVTWHYQWKIFPTCFHVLVITTCNCISVLYKVIFWDPIVSPTAR